MNYVPVWVSTGPTADSGWDLPTPNASLALADFRIFKSNKVRKFWLEVRLGDSRNN